MKKMQGEVQQLRVKLQNASTEVRNSKSERARLSDRCVELEAEIAHLLELTSHTNRLQGDLLQFQQANEKQEQRIQLLESNLSDSELMLSSKENEIVDLRQQHQSSYSGMTEIKHENSELLGKLQETNSRLLELESEHEALAMDVEEKNLTLEGLNEEVEALNEELKVLVNERDVLVNEKDSLEVETDEMLVQFGLLNEEMVEKEAETLRVQDELTRIQENLQIHEKELQDVKNEADAYREQLENERQQHEEQLKKTEEQLEDERRQKKQSQEKLEKTEEQLEDERSQKEQSQEQLEKTEEQLEDERRQKEQSQEQLEDERREREKAQEDLRAKESHEKELRKTYENNLQLAHRRSQEYEDQLHLSEEKLNALIRESEELTRNVGNVDENTKKLIEVNTALRDKIRAMASEQSATAEQLQAMESHKMGLNGKVDLLQNLVDELIASFEAKEAKLQTIIDSINFEKEEIANKSLSQESEISLLKKQLNGSKSAAEECITLRRNLTDFENKLSEQHRLLLQKDAATQDLYNQLQNADSAPVQSAEMEMLRESVLELETTVANNKKQLQEMDESCAETQQELMRAQEQLQTSEETVQQLKTDLDSKESIESTNHMLESRLDQLEQELMNARSKQSKHRDEASNLKKQIVDEKSSKDHSEEVSAELTAFRRKVEALEHEKEKSTAAASAREEAMEGELRVLQEQMALKNDQVAVMEEKLRSLDKDLHQSQQESNQKQESIVGLTAEVERLTALASESTSARILELTQHQAEDADKMRLQLVSLAQALEKSEIRRAEVLEKVESERESHGESLRRMTVNMKRFYATLKMSDI